MRIEHGSLFKHTACENTVFFKEIQDLEDRIYILENSIQLEIKFDFECYE
jgi:hypothetical protein